MIRDGEFGVTEAANTSPDGFSGQRSWRRRPRRTRPACETPRGAGDLGDRVLARLRRPLPERRPRRRGRSAPTSATVAAGGTADDERDLAAHVARRPLGELGQRARGGSPRRSWSARGRPRPGGRRRTPAARSASVAARRCGASKKTSVRGLGGERGQRAPPLARLARQEPLEAEPVDRQPGHRERGRHRGRPGQHGHRDSRRRPPRPPAGSPGRRPTACRRR